MAHYRLGDQAVIAPCTSIITFIYLQRGEVVFTRHVQNALEFVKREDGPTAVEYAVMLALIIVVCILSITSLGTNANKSFSRVANALVTAS